MFERFTEPARQVVVFAQDEARLLRHNYIGTEHLLLGLLRENEGIAARVLASLDVRLEEVRSLVAEIVGRGDELTSGKIPFTPRAKKVLELSLRECISFGHSWIGTEHVLLGLLRGGDGVANRILLDLDADPEKVRSEIIRVLQGAGDEGEWTEYGPPAAGAEDQWLEYGTAGAKPRSKGFLGANGGSLSAFALGAAVFAAGVLAGRLLRR